MATTRAMIVNAAMRRDPTRTLGIRLRFIRDMQQRFRKLMRDVRVSIVDRDVFGIADIANPVITMAAAPRKAFTFTRDEAKVDAFMAWLKKQEKSGVLKVTTRPGIHSGNKAWTDVYIDTAYQQGIRRAREALIKAKYPGVQSWDKTPGGVSAMMNQPVHAARAANMFTRTFGDLKTVMDVTNEKVRAKLVVGLSDTLTRGIAEGRHPNAIAKDIADNVLDRIDKVGLTRARVIARSEVIRAHNQAALAEYTAAKVEGVELVVEWDTDSSPCPICQELARKGPYEIENFPELPAHPNCECGAVPRPFKKGEKAAFVEELANAR